MRISNVNHVHIIADASAVRSRVIRAENLEVFSLAERGLEKDGEDMRLGMMILAAFARSSRGIEISQSHEFNTGIAAKFVEDALEDQLR